MTVKMTTLYQASCDQCGWFTGNSTDEGWVKQMAVFHRGNCPSIKDKLTRSGGYHPQ